MSNKTPTATNAPTDQSAAPDPLTANDAAFFDSFDTLYGQTWGESAIPAKYKELAGVVLSIAIRCEPCLRHHVRMAVEHGATKQEFVEAIRIAVLGAGSATIPTARLTYTFLKELDVL